MPIDLNHGSGYVPGQPPRPKAPPSPAELINSRIEQALLDRRARQPPREYIGASELGDPCLRRIYYTAIKAKAEPLTGKKLRVFEMGHVFEDMMVDWMRAAGFHLINIDKSTNKQFEFVTGNGRIKGHCDGFLIGGPDIGVPYPILWENKALKGTGWNAVAKHKLRKAEPKYFGQVQIMIGYFNQEMFAPHGMTLESCLFTALNKDTADIYPEFIPYELPEAQRISDRGVDVIKAVDSGIAPPRIGRDPDYYVCRMCGYRDFCWSVNRDD